MVSGYIKLKRSQIMTEVNQIYKCNICGNIVEVLIAAKGELVCCGQPMQLMKENTVDASTEKHVPVIERTENSVTVKVGSVVHPMEATFCVAAKKVFAREYCNIHGLWKA